MVSRQQRHDRLDQQIDRQQEERDADQPQRSSLSGLTRSRQLPEHDCRGGNVNEAVQPEPRQRDRRRREGEHGEHDHPDDVPTQGEPLQALAPAKKLHGCLWSRSESIGEVMNRFSKCASTENAQVGLD